MVVSINALQVIPLVRPVLYSGRVHHALQLRVRDVGSTPSRLPQLAPHLLGLSSRDSSPHSITFWVSIEIQYQVKRRVVKLDASFNVTVFLLQTVRDCLEGLQARLQASRDFEANPCLWRASELSGCPPDRIPCLLYTSPSPRD